MLVHADAPPLSLASGGTDVLWNARIYTRLGAPRLLYSASGGAEVEHVPMLVRGYA